MVEGTGFENQRTGNCTESSNLSASANMLTYVFTGTIRPDGVQLSLNRNLKFSHLGSGIVADAEICIIASHINIQVKTDKEWNIFDLRNVIKTILHTELAVLGYLKGLIYDFEIIKVLCADLNIDYRFSINIPCIQERNKEIDFEKDSNNLIEKTVGQNGIFVSRAITDLLFSMKYADDTAFYCYRALESLCKHCMSVYNITSEKSGWKKFREISNVEENSILFVKTAADPLRHGRIITTSDLERTDLLKKTWDIVDSYLKNTN